MGHNRMNLCHFLDLLCHFPANLCHFPVLLCHIRTLLRQIVNTDFSACPSRLRFSIIQLRRLVPRGHKSRTPKRQRAPFRRSRLMLVGPEQAASAFLHVQLQGLGARGHKPSNPKRQKTPFRVTRLMLVAPEQAPSAFLSKNPILHLFIPWLIFFFARGLFFWSFFFTQMYMAVLGRFGSFYKVREALHGTVLCGK